MPSGSDSDSDEPPSFSAEELLKLERQLEQDLEQAGAAEEDDDGGEYDDYEDRKPSRLFGLTGLVASSDLSEVVSFAPLPPTLAAPDATSSVPFDLSSLPGFSDFLRSSSQQSASLSASSLSSSSALSLATAASAEAAEAASQRRRRLQLSEVIVEEEANGQAAAPTTLAARRSSDLDAVDISDENANGEASTATNPRPALSLPSSSELFDLALSSAVRSALSDVLSSVEGRCAAADRSASRRALAAVESLTSRRDGRIAMERELKLRALEESESSGERVKARRAEELSRAKREQEARFLESINKCLAGIDVEALERDLGISDIIAASTITPAPDSSTVVSPDFSDTSCSSPAYSASILSHTISLHSCGSSSSPSSPSDASFASAALSRARAVRLAALAEVEASFANMSSSRAFVALFCQSRFRAWRGRNKAKKLRRIKRMTGDGREGGLARGVWNMACNVATRFFFQTWRGVTEFIMKKEQIERQEEEKRLAEDARAKEEARMLTIKQEKEMAERLAREEAERKRLEEEAKRLAEDTERKRKAEEDLAIVREEARRRREEQLLKALEAEEIRKTEAEALKRAEKAAADLRLAAEELARDYEAAAAERIKADGVVNAALFGEEKVARCNSPAPPPPSVALRACALSKAVSAIIHSDAVAASHILKSSSTSSGSKSHAVVPTPPAPRSRQPSLSSEGVHIDEDMLSGFGDLDKLISLALNVEQLTDASYLAMKGCTSLTSLSLNVNNLTSLQTLSGLKSLERLSVKDNKISSLDGMKPLQGLVELQCDVNSLTSLQTLTQGSWFNLTSFSANTNQISALPQTLSPHLPGLSMLSLYQNKISHIPENAFRSLPTLTSVDLGRNLLKDATSLAAALNKAPTMRRLVLSQNELKEAPLLGLPLLRQLWLSGNELESLDGWRSAMSAHLPCLEELHLQENRITRLGVGSGAALGLCCPILSMLDLSFNRIATVDDLVAGFAQCDYLKALEMQDNPVKASRLVEIRLLQVVPSLALLNGETLKPGIKWLAFSAPASNNAFVANFAIRSCIQGFKSVPMLSAVDKSLCDAAIAAWCKDRAGEEKGFACSVCSHNQFRENSTSCARCGAASPPKPVDPLLLDWRLLLPFGVVPEAKSSRRQLRANLHRAATCRALNVSGSESHSRWKRGFASESTRSRKEANEKHAEVLRSQLMSVEVGDESISWSMKRVEGNGWDTRYVVASKAGGIGSVRPSSAGRKRGSKTGSGLRMANSAIEGAAVMRVQCCVRRYFAAKRVAAIRRIAKKMECAGTIQRLWRGGIIRSRVRHLKSLTFDYVDPEIAEIDRMLGEETEVGGGLNLGKADLDDTYGSGWVPQKPVVRPARGSTSISQGWGTPPAGLSTQQLGAAPTSQQPQSSRGEISSPFGGRSSTRGEAATDSLDSAIVENLRRGGFDFNPGRGYPSIGASALNDDDMEVRSVSTAQLEEGVNGGGGVTDRSSGFMKTGGVLSEKNRKREEELMKDWGISDPKIVQNMMKRQNRLNKPMVEKAKADKMKDPKYRYEKLQKGLGKSAGTRGDIDRGGV